MSRLRAYAPLFTLAAGIVSLYCYGLAAVGVFEPDEPRYLAVGEAMARHGDWITPHLWGATWFEKPPLIYWMTALGARAGLGVELSGRVPTVILSLSFLAVMYALVRREFGSESAKVSVFLLATSAGWLAYSSLALTDIPLAVCFSIAVLLGLPLTRREGAAGSNMRWVLMGAALGLAALAKGLVPVALAVPAAWFLRRHWRRWWLAALSFLLVAGPWYAAVYARNGAVFVQEFFWKHHVGRLYSAALQHVQPAYYYVPVLLGGLFPWTPLFALLARGKGDWDTRRSYLAACCGFGFLLFSVSLNKLPGYLLPLLPAAFVLLGGFFEKRRTAEISRAWLLPCAVLIGLLPLIARVLPQALADGRLSLGSVGGSVIRTDVFFIAAPLAVVALARRSWAVELLVLCVVAGGLFIKIVAFPLIDRELSARYLWQHGLSKTHGEVCDFWLNRDWAYGLALYRGRPYPVCSSNHFAFALESHGHAPPVLRSLPQPVSK